MPHYAVTLVKASGPSQKSPGPDVTASRMLEDFGFEPVEGKNRDDMNEGASPALNNIVVRCETAEAKWFKLIRVEKEGKRARLIQLDEGRLFYNPRPNGDEALTATGHGRRLLDWEIVFEKRPLNETALNTHGEIAYDNRHRGSSRSKNGERIRTSVVNVSSRNISPLPVPFAPQPQVALAPHEGNGLPAKTEPTLPPAIPPPVSRNTLAGNGEADLVVSRIPAPAPTGEDTQRTSGETPTREYVAKVAMRDIIPDPDQPRQYFDEDELHAMAQSMQEESQVVLVIVRPMVTQEGVKYKIIDGERRWRSAKFAGIQELLVVIRPNTDDRKAFRQSVIANYNRKGHTVSESVNVIRRLLADGATAKEAWTLCGMSSAWYYDHTALMKLDTSLLKLIDPPTEKKHRLPVLIAKKLAYLPLAEQLPAYHRIMCEQSKTGRAVLADEIARPHMAENPRNKPSDHARTVERFVLRLRGSKRSFEHVDTASRALVLNRKPEQVELILSTLEESVRELTRLKTAIEEERQKANPQ